MLSCKVNASEIMADLSDFVLSKVRVNRCNFFEDPSEMVRA